MLIGQDCTKIWIVTRPTSLVAVGVRSCFEARHLSREVHELERTYEDVSMVGKTAKVVSFGAEADWRIVEFHPARKSFIGDGKHRHHYGNEQQEFEFHHLNLSYEKQKEKQCKFKGIVFYYYFLFNPFLPQLSWGVSTFLALVDVN